MEELGWSWYTGAASWYYKVVIENILGINIKDKRLYFMPCLTDDFDEYKVNLVYKSSRYRIVVKNKYKGKNEDITIILNGIKQEKNYFDLDGSDRDFIVEIEM